MNKLLYTGITSDTGKLLAADLNMNATGNVEKLGKVKNLIRWGNANGLGYTPENVINKMAPMRRCIDKLVATKIMRDNGVSVPIFVKTVPCVGRTSTHTQGQGFWFCWMKDQMKDAITEGADYFIDYIPVKQEYRVHVLAGRTVFVQKKYSTNRIGTAFRTIQGFRDGWHKVALPPNAASNAVRDHAERACECLGIEMGGVDVILGINDQVYVLEVNTGPALPTPETREPYVRYIQGRLK
jgi:predicted ATP-grasp superfamily ATP-dependent carboligase